MDTCETCGNMHVLTMGKCTTCWLLGYRAREVFYRKVIQDAIELLEEAGKLMTTPESVDPETWQSEEDWLGMVREWRDEYFPVKRKEI